MISQALRLGRTRRAACIVLFAGLVSVALVIITALVVPGQFVPQLERRLGAETGLIWRIGNASLATDLSLDLSDVSASDPANRADPPLFSAQTLKVSGLPRLLFGRAGTAQIAATNLSARGSVASLRDSKMSSGTLARLSEATLRIRGLRPQVTNSIKSGSATADAVDGTLRFDAISARSRYIALTLEGSDTVAKIDLREMNAAAPILSDALVRLGSEPKLRGSDKIDFNARLQISSTQIQLGDIRGTVDGSAFAGTAGVDLIGLPSFQWDLAFDRLAFVNDLETTMPAEMPVDGTPAIRAAALKRIDLAWLDRLQASGTTRVEDARIGVARAGGVETRTSIRDGTLDLAVTAGRFYDGTLRARYVLSRGTGGDHHQLGLSIQKARALGLLSDLIGVQGVAGATSIRFDAQAKGDQLEDVIKTMSGLGDLSVTEGSLNGLDLVGTTGLSPGGLGQTAAGLLSTRFSRLASTFRVENGRAATDDLRLNTPMIDTTGTGTIDLAAKTIDFTFSPALSGRSKPGLDIPVHIAGPWGSPAISTDFSRALANPSAAIQSMQDLGGALSKGGALDKGALGGLGGLLEGILSRGAAGKH